MFWFIRRIDDCACACETFNLVLRHIGDCENTVYIREGVSQYVLASYNLVVVERGKAAIDNLAGQTLPSQASETIILW